MLKAFAKLSLLFVITASVCIIIGVATPKWLSRSGHYQGLWRYCYYLTHADGKTSCQKLDNRADFEEWIEAVRVLVILSVVTAFTDFILLIVYLKKEDGHANLNRIRAAVILAMLSAVLCLAGIILYAVQKGNGYFHSGYEFSWSFILTTIGDGVMALVPLLLLLEIRRSQVLGSYESI